MRQNWGKILLLSFIPFLLSIPLQIVSGYYLVVNVGVFAYVLFLCDTIIGLRPKWLEKWIDLQNLYIAHGIIAVFAIILSLWHLLTGHVDGISNTLGYIEFYATLLLCVFAIFFLTSQVQRFFPFLKKPIRRLKEWADKMHFTRETNMLLHMAFPIIDLVIFFHVVTISYIRQYGAFYKMFLLYSAIFALLYLYEGIWKKLKHLNT